MCVHACVHLLTFFYKNLTSETIDWTFTKFHSSVPKIQVKIFSSWLQKNQACGAIQVLKDLYSFSQNVFHSYISLVRQNAVLCRNGLKDSKTKIA